MKTGLGHEALVISGQQLLEAVDTRTFRSARGARQSDAVSRTFVGNTSPTPRAYGAEGAWGVLDAEISRITVASVPTRALHRGYSVAGALDSIEASSAERILRTPLTRRRISIESRHTHTIICRVRHRRSKGVGRAQINESTRTERVGRAR